MLNRKGFTLIEVVVITLIIAALAVLVAPSFKNSAVTNEMEKAKIGLVELTNAVKLFYEVNPLGNIEGKLEQSNLNILTDASAQGYAYLNNGNRWAHRPGSETDYSLKGINCIYTIGTRTASEVTSASCKFKKDEDDVGECYKFSILRSNPAVIKKERLENCEGI